MTDVRAQRCAELADPVVQLTAAVVSCQLRDPSSFAAVIAAVEPVADIADKGTAGISDPDYLSWAAGAPEVLAAMVDAAERKDAAGVWAAFSDPQHGLHRLAAACEGLPKWRAPDAR